MKFLAISIVLFCTSLVGAQTKLETRTVEQYKSVINTANKWSENFLETEFYKDLTFKEKNGDKTKKFSDLSIFEQKIFILFQAEKLTDNLEYLEVEFKKDLELASKKDDKGKYIFAAKAKGKEDSAGRDDIEVFLKQIRDYRLQVAKKYEKYAESFFVENKDKFNEKEVEEYLKLMKSYHDKQSLIERK